MLFNPFTGKPRDPLDIASDPKGILIWDGEEPLRAAPKRIVKDEAVMLAGFEAELSKLSPAAQATIRDCMKRSESNSFTFFQAGFNHCLKLEQE